MQTIQYIYLAISIYWQLTVYFMHSVVQLSKKSVQSWLAVTLYAARKAYKHMKHVYTGKEKIHTHTHFVDTLFNYKLQGNFQ